MVNRHMCRNAIALVLLSALSGAASAATWAEQLFQEVSKDFGSVSRGPTLQHSFVVKNTTKDVVRISSLRVSCGCVTVTSDKSLLQPGEEISLLARMDTTRFLGVKSVTIFVQFDQPRFEEVRLWVRAVSRDDVVVTPDTLAFGQVKRGTTPTTTVKVSFHGNGNAKVVDAEAESNYVQPSIREVSRQAHEVVYEVTAKLRADTPVGKWFTDVWLKLDNQNTARIRVPLTVEIESALSVSPGIVALGDIKIDEEVERRVIVRGVKPFRITEIKGADDGMKVQDSADAAKPVHVVTIKWKPKTAGDLKRTLVIVTDLDGGSSVEVQAKANVLP